MGITLCCLTSTRSKFFLFGHSSHFTLILIELLGLIFLRLFLSHILLIVNKEGLLFFLREVTYIAKVSPAVHSLRLVIPNVIVISILFLFIFDLEHWLLRVRIVLKVLTASLETAHLLVYVGHGLVVGHFILFEWDHHGIGRTHHFAARTTTVGALNLLHLWHFLLRLGLRNDFIQVLIRVVKYDDWCGRLLALVHELRVPAKNLIFFLFVKYLVLLTNFLHNFKVD